jgi:hypothetical protein
VDISHTWCKRGEWGILNENANEKRLSQNHEEQKLKPQCSVVLQKQIYNEFCLSRNEENFTSNIYFTTKKNLKIFKYSQPENYPLKVYETALTGLATIMGKISTFSKNQGCGSVLIFSGSGSRV